MKVLAASLQQASAIEPGLAHQEAVQASLAGQADLMAEFTRQTSYLLEYSSASEASATDSTLHGAVTEMLTRHRRQKRHAPTEAGEAMEQQEREELQAAAQAVKEALHALQSRAHGHPTQAESPPRRPSVHTADVQADSLRSRAGMPARAQSGAGRPQEADQFSMELTRRMQRVDVAAATALHLTEQLMQRQQQWSAQVAQPNAHQSMAETPSAPVRVQEDDVTKPAEAAVKRQRVAQGNQGSQVVPVQVALQVCQSRYSECWQYHLALLRSGRSLCTGQPHTHRAACWTLAHRSSYLLSFGKELQIIAFASGMLKQGCHQAEEQCC